jgi:hypothetical protein
MKKEEVIARIAKMLEEATPDQLVVLYNKFKNFEEPAISHIGYGAFTDGK